MSNKIAITSAIKLSTEEITSLKSILTLKANDEVNVTIDPAIIAGLKVTSNGKTIDMSIKHQLTEIENG